MLDYWKSTEIFRKLVSKKKIKAATLPGIGVSFDWDYVQYLSIGCQT
jgi:hypothetical protein